MAQTNVVVGGDVKGDITSCKIENQIIKIDRKSAWSFTQLKTYISYNVCSKEVINQTTVPSFTGLGALSLFIGGVFLVVFFFAVFASWGNRY